MTPSQIERHLNRRFMERCVSVAVKREKLRHGGNALEVRWSRDTRKDYGIIVMATDSPLEEIIEDIESDLARKERGA